MHDFIVYNPITGNILSRNQAVKSDVYPRDWKLESRPILINSQNFNRVDDPKFNSDAIDPATHLISESDNTNNVNHPTIPAPPIDNSQLFPITTQMTPITENIVPVNIPQPQSSGNLFEAAPMNINLNNSTTSEAAPPIPIINPIPIQSSPIRAPSQPVRRQRIPSAHIIEPAPTRQSTRNRIPNRFINIHSTKSTGHIRTKVNGFTILTN